MQLYDLPITEAPAEKLVALGVESLSDVELLSIILTTNEGTTKAIGHATELLKSHSLPQLLSLSVSELTALPGITVTNATVLVAACGLCQLGQVSGQLMITQPSKVADMMTYLASKTQEHVVALYLNSRNVLIEQKTIAIGTVNAAPFYPRDVFAPAIVSKASGIILVHNHPSGICLPSAEDVAMTKNLEEMGKLLEIPLVDHVIVSKNGWKSLKQEKMMGMF